MGEKINIKCGNIRLEGVLHQHSRSRGAIVCHPHPLYGGNMENPVVETISRAFCERNITCLRFNFRGTCNSTGMFDNGNGEQEDVLAVLSFLAQAGYEQIWLAGYSFGARVNAAVVSQRGVSQGCEIKDHIMVSPPVGFMSFDDIETLPHTGLVITGVDDEIAPASLIQDHLNRWKISPRYEIIDNCDHFYSGRLDRLKAVMTDYLP
jgi:hypothetical protein